ncbi:MAG: hydrogenase maturation protease [Rhodospirillales bacterium]|jgi:hydrogenase maturation protease|nr:hydrogenase maturation protease [Rhodospirillales bacterium]
MSSKAIICVGNRMHEADALGGLVYDALTSLPNLPGDTEIFDGGLKGLDLLGFVENRRRVVFVDALDFADGPNAVRIMEREEVAGFAVNFGHSAGLPYLFSVMPKVCSGLLPEILLIGAAGPATPPLVRQVVNGCLELIEHGYV